MTANDVDLLGQFTREHSQDAFTALVNRHLNLVYSAAQRQVRSPQLAEEVSQTVFTNLACNAAKLKPDTILTAWLYQVTRHTAIDVVRREAGRQAREQIAFQMSDLNETSADWKQIEAVIDEGMHSLDDTDRTALLLRYFENKSLREVGEAIGASEDAAQKRVSRAIERLREYFSKRKVAVGASGLAALVCANAAQAAPAGLAATIASGAMLASNLASASTAITVTNTIVMTTLQKTIITLAITGTAAVGFYQAHRASGLRDQVKVLQQQQADQTALSNQVQELQRERDRITNRLASLAEENAALKKNPTEVLKLRGEVGRLRQENVAIGSSSAISKITANPESRKLLRDQQKLGMGAIYKGFTQRSNLSTEQAEKFNDLLADHIMQNVDHVTTVLRDKPDAAEMNRIFAAQEAVLQEQLQSLIGQDGVAQYQEYTKNLLSTLSSEQFKGMLTGSDTAKAEKTKQLLQAMQEEVQSTLSSAGLPSDFQVLPILNFRNIASEQEAEVNLKLMEGIYERVAVRGGSFLTPEELLKFQEFRAAAIKNSRSALAINRTMMAPISQ